MDPILLVNTFGFEICATFRSLVAYRCLDTEPYLLRQDGETASLIKDVELFIIVETMLPDFNNVKEDNTMLKCDIKGFETFLLP